LRSRSLPETPEDLSGLRAAAWIRVSTKGQTDNFGPEAQRTQIERAILRLGLKDTGIQWEVAHSGRTIDQTAEWRDMVAQAGETYDVLLVGYVSRFTRNLEIALSARRILHNAGAALYFCDERILSSDETAWDSWVREAHESESYSRKLGRRVMEGYESKRLRKGVPGGNRPPFGLLREEKGRTLVVDPERIEIVRRAYQLSADGFTDRDVALRLDLKKTHISEILTNPVYRGRLHRGETSAAGEVIDPLLWDKVQQRRASAARRRPGRGTQRVYPLSHLLYCANCGKLLTAHVCRFRHIDACPEFKAAKPEGVRWATRGESYDVDLYEAVIPAILEHVASGADLLPDVMEELAKADEPEPDTLGRIQRQREAAARKVTSDRDMKSFQATLERLDAEEREAREGKRTTPTREQAREYLSDLPSLWYSSGPEERQRLMRALFERIEVMGVEEVRIFPTREALDYGWFEAWAGKTLRVPLGAASLRYGRGERI
jgi:DNA invertase Pin-like site-specific DNA recombinase